MLQESEARSRAAAILHEGGDDSDSAYLLRLLSFELLLKLLIEEQTGTAPARHHRYAELFAALPPVVQEQFLTLAKERIGPSALNENALGVLEELGANFAALRYPFERYAGLDEEQYEELGRSWSSAGAPLEQATFRYHPEELFGLCHAARQLAGG